MKLNIKLIAVLNNLTQTLLSHHTKFLPGFSVSMYLSIGSNSKNLPKPCKKNFSSFTSHYTSHTTFATFLCDLFEAFYHMVELFSDNYYFLIL